jgi:GH43 family beta-xylosidase
VTRVVSALATVLLALATAAAAAAPASALRNPLIPQTAAGDDTPDPWLFRHGGRYWLTYTSTDHVEVRSAATLDALASAAPKRLWPRAGKQEPTERCCALCAPELHRFADARGRPRWYAYYAANGPAGDTHRMYVLESAGDDPGGPYHFKARLRLPRPFAIDGTVAEVGGKLYLVYSGGAAFAPTSLSIARLQNPWTVSGRPLTISSPTLDWERGVFPINEGPEVLVHGSTLNVIYSASWCGTKAYSLGRLTVSTRADLLAASTWRAAKHPSPVFATDAARGVFGPGHGSFFTSPDGRESWMAYHATEADNGCFTGGVRTTRVQKLTWNEDGTPDFGTPVALSADIAAPGGDGTIAVQAETALPAGAGTVVADRRLFGYQGLRVAAPATLAFRVRVARAGRYALHLRVLGGPAAGDLTQAGVTRSARRATEQALDLALGARRLPAGTSTLRLRTATPLTLDQLRLERRRASR